MKNIFVSLVAFFIFINLVSCVEDEMYKGPATITNVTYSPSTITPDDAVHVTVNASDLQGISAATIAYSVNGAATQKIGMTASGNTTFVGDIPPQADKAAVIFNVSVLNKDGFTTTSKDFSYTVGAVPTDYTQLVLNEIDGNNKTIELYNKGTKSIPLDGIMLIKNNTGEWWKGTAAAGKIEAGKYILIVQDNSDTNFSGAGGISTKQNLKFELKDPAGNSLGIFLRGDEASLGGTISNVAPKSYQRIPNGTGDWQLADPTTGMPNATTGEIIPQK